MRMKRNMKGGARKKPTSLQVAAKMWSEVWDIWPTPNVPNGGRMMSLEDVLNKGYTKTGRRQVYLGALARRWSEVFEDLEDPKSRSSRLSRESSTNGKKSSNKSLFLNPVFATWLMNWPQGWADPNKSLEPTSYDSWATASCRLVQHMLSECSPFDWPEEKKADEPPSMFEVKQ
jgi:hypothetical protein